LNRDEVVLRCNVSFSCSTTGEKHMFRIIGCIERFCERVIYGPEDDSDREVSQALDRAFRREPDDFANSWLQDFTTKERLNQELANAVWILAYEKRLTKLQKKAAAHRSEAEQLRTNTERLRRLEHHLAGLRRNLSLD
jgi:hypothetical protein